MTSLRYIRRWCVVKGDQSWNFETRDAADDWSQRVSATTGEQADVYEWVDNPAIVDRGGSWVWRFTTLVVVCEPGEAA